MYATIFYFVVFDFFSTFAAVIKRKYKMPIIKKFKHKTDKIKWKPLSDSCSVKISFFNNIFYWHWHTTPKSGIPERSWLIISVFQYFYFLFFVSLVLSTLNDDMRILLYETDKRITIGTIMIIYVIMLEIHVKMYNEKRYLRLKNIYAQISEIRRKEYKRTFIIYVIVSILVAIVTVKLLMMYFDNVKKLQPDKTRIEKIEQRLQIEPIL